jgi:predicted DsbA family dithiol-disulfide isomerase
VANEVVHGTLDSGKQKKMIDDASAGIAPGKTAPTSVQDWKQRVSQADTASKEMFDMLESVRVDIDNLNKEQQAIIADAERQLRDDIISGTVTQDQTSDKIRELCNQVTSELTPPKGGAYVTIMNSSYQSQQQYKQDIKDKREELEASIDTTFDEMKTWLFDNRQIDAGKLTDAQKAEYYNTQRDIRNRLANGSLTKEESVQMYSTLANRLSSTEYQYEYRNAYGKKVIGTISTDELIDPENNTIGARLARYALELVNQNLEYNARIILNPRAGAADRRRWISIDCSGLVKYAAYQINPKWMKDTIGNKAENQMKRTGENVVWQETVNQHQPNIDALEAGDLLYWADENNKIVHTAIYLGDGLMVESEGSVRITDIRFTTIDNDGSEHKLVQVNRLDEIGETSDEKN